MFPTVVYCHVTAPNLKSQLITHWEFQSQTPSKPLLFISWFSCVFLTERKSQWIHSQWAAGKCSTPSEECAGLTCRAVVAIFLSLWLQSRPETTWWRKSLVWFTVSEHSIYSSLDLVRHCDPETLSLRAGHRSSPGQLFVSPRTGSRKWNWVETSKSHPASLLPPAGCHLLRVL